MARSPATRGRVRDMSRRPRSPRQGCEQCTAATRSPQTFERAPGSGRDGVVMRDRAFARAFRCICRRSTIGVCAAALLAFSGCERAPPHPDRGPPGINVVVLPGPSTWFTGPNGVTSGLDHELLTRFASERGVPLNVTFADGPSDLFARLRSGQAQLGAG